MMFSIEKIAILFSIEKIAILFSIEKKCIFFFRICSIHGGGAKLEQ